LGGRAGVVGENGLACGGALSRFRSHSSPAAAFEIFVCGFILCACSRQTAAPPPDAAAQLEAIGVADPAKYPSLQENKHWSNPYLVIRVDRVGLLSDIAANEEQILKPEAVVNALAQLPASAWPYGRAVAILVDEKHANSEQDKIALRRNRGIVEGELEEAKVAIRWIPSS
jgi:hypothetical protein